MAKNLGRAFTLFELVIVILVIAILASIAYPIFIGTQERAKVVKDMNNLRQIGIATQLYMNDNGGALPGSTTATWMSQLCPKYTGAWGIFKSPLDTRPASEGGATGSSPSPVSYGINANVYPPPNNVAISVDKIANPILFILFAPAQDSSTSVDFQGTAALPPPPAPGVTEFEGTSNAGGTAVGGTHNYRKQISAIFADLHCETMPWTTFTSDSPETGATCSNGSPPPVSYRWHPDPCNP